MNARKPPEDFREDQPENAGSTWINVPEAALLLPGASPPPVIEWTPYDIPKRGERPVRVSQAAIGKHPA